MFEASEFTINVSKPGGSGGSSSLLQGDNETHYPAAGVEENVPFVEIFVDDYTISTLCSLGQSGAPCTTAALMDTYKMGDNSREKEHQWELDLVPKIRIDSYLGRATSVDLRSKNPKCFPGTNGKNVVRNQITASY